MEDSIHWLILTGLDSADGDSTGFVERRRKEIEAVTNLYGFSTV